MFTGLTFAENYGCSVDTGIGMPRASIIPAPGRAVEQRNEIGALRLSIR